MPSIHDILASAIHDRRAARLAAAVVAPKG